MRSWLIDKAGNMVKSVKKLLEYLIFYLILLSAAYPIDFFSKP